MEIKRLLAVLVVVPLLGAASAEAKTIKWVRVCGPSECAKTPGNRLDSQRWPLVFPPWVMSDPRPDPPPPRAARWLRVEVALESDLVSSVVVPRLGYAGGDDGPYGYVWQRLDQAEQRTYRRLRRGIDAFRASTLPGLE